MSTPMYELPEHLLMGVDKDGNGPVGFGEEDHWACWCGDPRCNYGEELTYE